MGSKFRSFRSQSIETNLTHKTHVMIGVFSCVKWTERKLNTNQLEIAQNEIWTPQKFPAIRYMWTTQREVAGVATHALVN